MTLTALLLAFECPSHSADMTVIERWMATNRGVRSLRVDFTETRTMKSLNVPIRKPGSLWLDYGTSRFRWQTGDPAQTIVVRRGPDLFILRTPQKKFERRPLGSGSNGAPGMSALAGGFPRSVSEFQQKYHILSITPKDNTFRVATIPRGPAGRGVASFTFVLGADHHRLIGIEIELRDGSSVHTVFNRVQPNIALHEGLFAPDLRGYQETKF